MCGTDKLNYSFLKWLLPFHQRKKEDRVNIHWRTEFQDGDKGCFFTWQVRPFNIVKNNILINAAEGENDNLRPEGILNVGKC